MPNLIKSGTTVSNGTLKRNNFLIGVNTSVAYGPTSSTGFWASIIPPNCGYTMYTQKASQGPSIFTSDNDLYVIITAQKLGGTNINTIYDALSWFNGQPNHLVTNFDYPNIVTSGLTLMFDVAYLPSYPRTGSTLNDLSGNNSSATLYNSPTFSSSNIGILNFSDTSLQYGLTPNLGNLSQWTVEAWFNLSSLLTGKVTSIISNELTGSNSNFSIGTNNFQTNSNLAVGFYDGTWRSTTGFVPTTNVWYQVVGTYDGSTIRQYINGVASGGTLSYAGSPTSGGGARLMRRWDDTATSSNYVNGNLAIAYVYNRALSATEVLQNYNSLSPRFDPSVTPCPANVTPTPTTTPTPTPTPTGYTLNYDISICTNLGVSGFGAIKVNGTTVVNVNSSTSGQITFPIGATVEGDISGFKIGDNIGTNVSIDQGATNLFYGSDCTPDSGGVVSSAVTPTGNVNITMNACTC